MLFGTTEEFLRVFGLASLDDLPPLAAFQSDPETMAASLADLEKNGSEQEGVVVEDFVRDRMLRHQK